MDPPRKFFSLDELNIAIAELLEELNARPMKELHLSRREAFERYDRGAMLSLVCKRYVVEHRKDATVHPDYMVVYDERRYTVPCALMGERVEIRATGATIEIFHNGMRVALHRRSYGPIGAPIVQPEHQPSSHREYGRWSPERILECAGKRALASPALSSASSLVISAPSSATVPPSGCLAKTFGAEHPDAACARALAARPRVPLAA